MRCTRVLTLAIAAGTWCLVGSLASAQQGYGPPPYFGYGGLGAGGYGMTPISAAWQGMADAIRSEGQYNLMTSAAAVNAELAYKQALENEANRLKWTRAFFQMRGLVPTNLRPRSTPEDWVRRAQEMAPMRLSPSALDPQSGRIDWPIALQAREFERYRAALDELFAMRANSPQSLGIDVYTTIRETTDAMMETLRHHIRDIEPKYYMDARNFLQSLAYEASFPDPTESTGFVQ